MLLNSAVPREIDSELKRHGLKPLALGIALSVGERKASALIRGHDVWTMALFEAAAEMLGIGLDVLLLVARADSADRADWRLLLTRSLLLGAAPTPRRRSPLGSW